MEFFSRRVLRAALPAIALIFGGRHDAAGDKYDGMVVTFDKPAAEVHKAAVDALTVVGVEIKKDEANVVEGKRKNKMGAFVGSGGEILTVSLTSDRRQQDRSEDPHDQDDAGSRRPEGLGSAGRRRDGEVAGRRADRSGGTDAPAGTTAQ